MLSHFGTWAGVKLNIVDVIFMIDKFFKEWKLWSIFKLKWQEKLANLCYFPVKKMKKKISAVNFRLNLRGKKIRNEGKVLVAHSSGSHAYRRSQ